MAPAGPPLGVKSLNESRPTVADLHGDNHYARLARENWSAAPRQAKFRQDILKNGLWDPLEKEEFAYRSLLILENLQALEK